MAIKEAKKNVQKEFRKQMILYVDTSEQDSGSINNKNMVRRFFRYPDLLKIIGVDKIFIRRFGIILQTLACEKKINTVKLEKLEKHVLKTAETFILNFILSTCIGTQNYFPWKQDYRHTFITN